MRASLAGEVERAEGLLGAALPAGWPDNPDLLRMRLDELAVHPDREPWLTRGIVHRETECMIGVTGFHGPPGGEWLGDVAPGGVEFGYTVFEPWRRRGFAEEASRALVAWARREHRVARFVLSIDPQNAASAALATKLGFVRVSSWHHPVRGLEHVFRLGPEPDAPG